MNIGLYATEVPRDIMEHTKNVSLGLTRGTTCILWDKVQEIAEPLQGYDHLNNTVGLHRLQQDSELEKEFRNSAGLVSGDSAFYLYGFIGKDGLGPLLEFVSKHKFMSGDIGPDIGFVNNSAIAVSDEIYQAVPGLSKTVEYLQAMEYYGEITFACNTQFQLVNVYFGHNSIGYSLACEVSKQSPYRYFEWCLEGGKPYAFHENRIAVSTLLSVPPFPHAVQGQNILTPPGAEKHIYRFHSGGGELSYVACWGEYVQEAKRRCMRTIAGCRNYNPDLQYRNDFGHKDKFVFSAERYAALGGVS